eukprot:s2352_g4.t1
MPGPCLGSLLHGTCFGGCSPQVHRLLDEAKLPEVAEDEIAALLARESDPDESDGCDLVAGKEGGTGNSSECSEDFSKVDAEFEEERGEPKEAPPATRKDEPTEAAPQKAEESTLPLPASSSMARQTSPSISAQVKVASPVLGPAASPGHDAVEDGLVQQLEIERDLDAAFSDRRLLAEAEATDPEKLGITRGYREVESPAALPAVSPAPAAPTPPPSDVKVETPAVLPAAAVSVEPEASGAPSTDVKDAPAELQAPAPSADDKEAPKTDAPTESPPEPAIRGVTRPSQLEAARELHAAMGSGASALEKASTSDVKEALASLNDEEQKKLGEALAKLDAKAEEPAPAEKKEAAPAEETKPEAGSAELSAELKAKLQECFDAIDTNKNGTIEASEFKSVMNKLAVPLNDDQIEKLWLEHLRGHRRRFQPWLLLPPTKPRRFLL